MQNYSSFKVTITLEGGAKFSSGSGSVNGNKLTYTINNDSNPWYADPKFSANGTNTIYFNFVNNKSGKMNITVEGIK